METDRAIRQESRGAVRLSSPPRRWRRSQPIRIVAQLPLVFALTQARQPFKYQHIGETAGVLCRLGMSASSIARRRGVSDKTVTKALGRSSVRHRARRRLSLAVGLPAATDRGEAAKHAAHGGVNVLGIDALAQPGGFGHVREHDGHWLDLLRGIEPGAKRDQDLRARRGGGSTVSGGPSAASRSRHCRRSFPHRARVSAAAPWGLGARLEPMT
jgi:hypothetical protein